MLFTLNQHAMTSDLIIYLSDVAFKLRDIWKTGMSYLYFKY